MSSNFREYVLQHPLFQTLSFALVMLLAGAVMFAYADEYVTDRVSYGMAIHEIKGAHLEARMNHYDSLIGQHQIRIGILNAEKRELNNEIFIRKSSSDSVAPEQIQYFQGEIQKLDEELAMVGPEMKDAIKQRDFYRTEIQKRPVPVKP